MRSTEMRALKILQETRRGHFVFVPRLAADRNLYFQTFSAYRSVLFVIFKCELPVVKREKSPTKKLSLLAGNVVWFIFRGDEDRQRITISPLVHLKSERE